MVDIKLGKIPDRTPVKLTIQLLPDLIAALQDYADAYEASYGKTEMVADMVPAMLVAFLDSDREFMKARRTGRTSP